MRKDDQQYLDDYQEENANSSVEIKVSSDGGETWQRRKINMSAGLDESGLQLGELFMWQEEKYLVSMGDEGLKAEKLKKASTGKKKR